MSRAPGRPDRTTRWARWLHWADGLAKEPATPNARECHDPRRTHGAARSDPYVCDSYVHTENGVFTVPVRDEPDDEVPDTSTDEGAGSSGIKNPNARAADRECQTPSVAPLDPEYPEACRIWRRRALPVTPKQSMCGSRREAPAREPVAKQQAAPIHDPQHFLNFAPLPHGHGSLRPTEGARTTEVSRGGFPARRVSKSQMSSGSSGSMPTTTFQP